MQETFRSFLPAARTSSTVLEVEFHPDMSPRPGPLEQGALESPKKLEELDRQEEVLPLFFTSPGAHTPRTQPPAVLSTVLEFYTFGYSCCQLFRPSLVPAAN